MNQETRLLILMRHGKAAKDLPVADQARPLTDRGRDDAELAGIFVATRELQPERILSSPAVRARQTAQAFCAGAQCSAEQLVEYVPALYGGDVNALRTVVAAQAPELHRVMVIGHNPEMEELAQRLVELPEERLPTASLVCLRLRGNWHDLKRENVELIDFARPKELRRVAAAAEED